jgi:hypothetical protein
MAFAKLIYYRNKCMRRDAIHGISRCTADTLGAAVIVYELRLSTSDSDGIFRKFVEHSRPVSFALIRCATRHAALRR